MPSPNPETSSTSAEEAKFQPPFAPTGTSPQADTGAEGLVNAAAKHAFPTHPAPSGDDDQDQEEKKATAPGIKDEPVGEEEEQPIATGTPLDEIKTPVLERGTRGKLSTLTEMPNQESKQSSVPRSEVLLDEAESSAGGSEKKDEDARPRQEPRSQDSGDTLTPKPSIPELHSKASVGSSGSAGQGSTSRPRASTGYVRPPSSKRTQERTRSRTTTIGRPPMLDRDIGSVRMGASALFSALNALPWQGEESDTGSSDEDVARPPRRRDGKGDKGKMGASVKPEKIQRPKVSRMHSSLHTIRPMAQPVDEDLVEIPQSMVSSPSGESSHHLHFPFRENTIARRARSPGQTELAYQYAEAARRRKISIGKKELAPAGMDEAGVVPPPKQVDDLVVSPGIEQVVAGDDGLTRGMVGDRIKRKEVIGGLEEIEELSAAARETNKVDLGRIQSEDDSQSNVNVEAALREEKGSNEIIEERMPTNMQEKKRQRREILSQKLMEGFGLDEEEEVLEEMKCWLLRSVMLKGYMYLTKKHICFFAHMPGRENIVVKTGALHKKASRTKLNTKFWVVLRNDVLSWYESTADPYFPKGNVSLQYASSCDAIDETRFKLRTSERNYTFTAETEKSRDEWIKAIEKVMFKTQHEGECVKLIIPLEAVLDVDRSPTLEFAETIEVKCVDSEDQMSVDSYFFACFNDPDAAFASLNQLLDDRPVSDLPRVSSRISFHSDTDDDPRRSESDDPRRSESDGEGIRSSTKRGSGPLGLGKVAMILKPVISRVSQSSEASEPEKSPRASEDSKSGSSFSIPFLGRHKPSHDSLETLRTDQPSPKPSPKIVASPLAQEDESDGYPPRQSGRPPKSLSEGGGKGWGQWIKKPAKIFGTSPGSQSSLAGRTPSRSSIDMNRESSQTSSRPPRKHSVTEIVEPFSPVEDQEADDELSPGQAGIGPKMSFQSERSESDNGTSSNNRSEYDIMERSESGTKEDEDVAKKFRSVFSLPEKEELIEHFPGWLYRVLPVSGRFFVSTNYFCFRSSQLLYKTKMIVPIRDLYGLKAQKAFRFGHCGLIVVIKGHEELFLEFSSSKRRKACIALLEERMEDVRLRQGSDSEDDDDSKTLATRIMEDLDESAPVEDRHGSAPMVPPSTMFGSTTSTFLEFKPDPMTITCLTIGSRGDVQPYIALCKGLQAEGHRTRIATHGEYKDWVEGHGIEFASVGGDPAELMQMCVDNGMFTVSFLKEGLQKFRGWLDELLNSSWEACQGSDLLIESPSAMGGIHIAEALRIPYYRAFTMPWTRTRAYPHAFAVPEHKRGGSYNYMTYTMFDQVFWRAISGQVNRWRKKVLEIDTTTFDKLDQHKVPFLYNFSPNVVPPPLDWTEWIHVTGYWFLENAEESKSEDDEWTPPEGLLEFIDNAHKLDKKVVYIGFGSIVVSDPEAMTRCVVDAVVDSGVHAILSKGWSDRGSKAKGDAGGDSEGADGIKYPPEIFSIDSIDHTWLFPRIDAACHHGGAGTSGASLRAGIPTIIKPFFGDQAFWSERVESLNVGSAVRKLTPEHLADALRKATTDEKQIAKAKVVGEMIRKENGVARAIEAIYRDLEYAKSLIKPLEDKHLSKANSLLHPLGIELDRLAPKLSPSPSRTKRDKPRTDSSSSQQTPPMSTSSLPGSKTQSTTSLPTKSHVRSQSDAQSSFAALSAAPEHPSPLSSAEGARNGHGSGNGDASDTSSWDVLSEHGAAGR